MRQMTILVDMDDVLTDLLHPWVQNLNQWHGLDVNPETINEWDMKKFFPSLTKREIFAPLHDVDFWKTVRPKEDAPKYVRQLVEDGHKVYVVTSTHYDTVKPKMENVLFKYFPYLKWGNVILAENKHLIHGDVLIDDGYHNLSDTQPISILMDMPHNRNIPESTDTKSYLRMFGWKEIYDYISNFAEVEDLLA